MSNIIKKQDGYTVLIVLLIIVVIGLAAPPLVSSVMNSSVQYKKSEENVQLENVVDMGKQYFRSSVEKMIYQDNLFNGKTATEVKETLSNIDYKQVDLDNEKPGENIRFELSYNYKNGNDPIKIVVNNLEKTATLKIDYISTAKVGGESLEELETIEFKLNNIKIENPPIDNNGNDIACLKLKGNKYHLSGKDYCEITLKTPLSADIKITGKATLIVHGDAKLTGTVFLAGNGSLYIKDRNQISNPVERGNGQILLLDEERTHPSDKEDGHPGKGNGKDKDKDKNKP